MILYKTQFLIKKLLLQKRKNNNKITPAKLTGLNTNPIIHNQMA